MDDKELIVAHIVWPASVRHQLIYEEIEEVHKKNSVRVSNFHPKSKRWLQKQKLVVKETEQQHKVCVWDRFLQNVFIGPKMKKAA